MNNIDIERIKIMTKLAIYDKTYGESDKLANSLYYRDYVYRRNFKARAFALVGCLIPFGIYTIFLIIGYDIDLINFDYFGYLRNIGIIIAIIMVIYTLVGTRIATEEYKNIKLRLQEYFKLISELDEITNKKANNSYNLGNDEYNNNEALESYKTELRNKYANNLRN